MDSSSSRSMDSEKLFADAHDFTAQHVGWSEEFRAGAVAWCMATWVHKQFDSFPYLQFIGPPGRGKSRSTKVIAALSYEPFECACTTPAVIFRKANQGVTLILDEVDESLSRETRNVMRYGFNRGGKVMKCRTVTRHADKVDTTDFEPTGWDPYCPKVLSGQTPLGDAALQTRIITMNMAKAPMRGDGSAWLPYLPESFETDKASLRIRLGQWAKDCKVNPAGVRLPDSIESRQAQVFLPLYAVVSDKYRPLIDSLLKKHADYVARYTSGSIDNEIVQTLVDMGCPETFYPGSLADRMNMTRPADDQVSSKHIGNRLEHLGFERRKRTNSGIPFGCDGDQISELALSMGIKAGASCS